MLRTHTCGELTKTQLNQEVTLCGWVQKIRNKGFIVWIDLRDRFGITQLVFDEQRTSKEVFQKSLGLGREYVIQIKGKVLERESKNSNLLTGEIEIMVEKLDVISKSETPPFTIETETDGGEELRMKYRYLDIRRDPIRENLIFRHKVTLEIRNFLSNANFIDVETPCLIKSTPEGARDFVVPSRINPGQFYALPQSPQTFKQLLIIGGIDRYFQIVKCFRDEDLRADRQPEFTQIDCEMAFITQDDILIQFEEMIKHLLKKIKGIEINSFPRLTYSESMSRFGSDKPDIRFGMELTYLDDVLKNKGFDVFDKSESIIGISIPEASSYTRKEIDSLIEWVKKPQIGSKGLIWIKYLSDGSFKSSIDKFFTDDDFKKTFEKTKSKAGDLILIMAGEKKSIQSQMGMLRLEMGERLGLRNPKLYAPLWIIDFPLLQWNEDDKRYYAMHHPFTSPKTEDIDLLDTDPSSVRANAHDLILNGNEIGGGSIRIHDSKLQKKLFSLLGFSEKKYIEQFGFLIDAFKYGAPPHGGIAIGLDRLVAILGESETIRDFIAFPKNNAARDVMIDAPSELETDQLKELNLKSLKK
ncbi:MAG: aspartate--tRNA ligase [Flavobacteriaceae bacterium]|nr:aspartate--tRNA ligase [Flavobacteriaceae bacterium]